MSREYPGRGAVLRRMMLRRIVAAPLLVLPVVAACMPAAHFPDITDTMARRDLGCGTVFVKQLEPWAYRADGCGRTAFYRCSYGAKSAGREQCCQQTVDEDAATALLAPNPPSPYCEHHYE
jgi:hypothetical protein